MAERPTGVTIICILGWIGAILSIIGGAALAFLGPFLAAFVQEVPALVSGALLMGLGVVTLILGIVLLVAFYWLWQMKKTGWTIVMVLEIISLITGLVSLSWFQIIIALIIVLYLYTKRDLFK